MEGRTVNSNDMNGHKLWSYVHNQLSQADRLAVDQAVASDPELRKQLTRMKELDQQMRKLLPIAGQSDQAFEDRVLKAWENASQPVPERANAWTRIMEWLMPQQRPAAAFRLALAGAACLLLLVAGYNYLQGPLGWSKTVITAAPSYRGGETNSTPFHDLAALDQETAGLRHSLRSHYEMASPQRHVWQQLLGRKAWILSATIQLLPQDKLLVQVAASRTKGGKPVQEWSRYFSNAKEFSRQMDAWATEISEALVELHSKGNDTTGAE